MRLQCLTCSLLSATLFVSEGAEDVCDAHTVNGSAACWSTPDTSIDGAYSLHTPEDSVALYRAWSRTYDSSFIKQYGYDLALVVANIFLKSARSADHTYRPILDAGAGTGAVAEHLPSRLSEIDALDISRDMLDVAASKRIYNQRLVADLTKKLDIRSSTYGAVLSAETFTHGHVGPNALPELLRIARRGALFVLAINEHVFDTTGFGTALAKLVSERTITPVLYHHSKIYNEDAMHSHARDMAFIARFHKL